MKLFAMIALLALTATAGIANRRPCIAQEPVRNDGALSQEMVKLQLQSLGYDVSLTGTNQETAFYTAAVIRNNRSYPVGVNLSPDKTVVWLNLTLVKIDKPAASEGRFQRLMERNREFGPSCFTYDAQTRCLMYSRPCDNRGLTAQILDDKIDRMLKSLEATRADWDIEWNAASSSSYRPGR